MRHDLQSWILLCLASLPAQSPGLAIPAERGTVAKSPARNVLGLVEQLEDADFAAREEASRELLDAGADAIPTLAEAALMSPPEAATRVLHVLEAYLLSAEKSKSALADDALVSLADGDQGFVALKAAGILARHRLLREQRAVVAIRELGGTVRFGLNTSSGSSFRGALPIGPGGEVGRAALKPSEIVIGTDWQGGTDGLKYLRHLGHWEGLILYVVRGSGVPLAEAEKLAASMPGLMVHERGAAYLGIGNQSSWDTNICVVGTVVEDGPAGRAGLERGDIIRELNGREIATFDDLIEKLKDHAAGEKLPITIDRSNNSRTWERLTVTVEMGKWNLPDYTEDALEAIQHAEAQKLKPQDAIEEPAIEPDFPRPFLPFER